MMMKAQLNEWEALAVLLDSGISIEEALTLAFKDASPYLKRLKEGDKNFLFKVKQTDRFSRYLRFFLCVAPMGKAIRMSLYLCAIQNEMIRQIWKDSAYPILLFLMAFLFILFFLSVIFPQMQQMSGIETTNIASMILYAMRFAFFILLTMFCLLSCFILFVYFQKDARKVVIMHFHHKLSFIQDIISYLFASYLAILMDAGIATQDALLLLERLEDESIIYPCIIEVRKLLEQGFSYDKIVDTSTYFSLYFRRYFKIGLRSTNLAQTLRVFLEVQQQHWKKSLKTVGHLLQLFVYGVIAVLVFCVYQMLLMPLDMLNQF